jgi:hypothetical protein
VKAKEARDLILGELKKRKLPYQRVRSKTVSFQDLARANKVFIDVYGLDVGDHFAGLKLFASSHGFIVQFHKTYDTTPV